MSNNKLQIGVIGLGYFGPNWLRNIKNNLRYELSWICDLNKNRLDKFSNIYNIETKKTFLDYKEAISYKIPDLVLIATPPSTHLPIGEKLISEKINLIIEKFNNNKNVIEERYGNEFLLYLEKFIDEIEGKKNFLKQTGTEIKNAYKKILHTNISFMKYINMPEIFILIMEKSKILKMFPNMPDVVMGDIGWF